MAVVSIYVSFNMINRKTMNSTTKFITIWRLVETCTGLSLTTQFPTWSKRLRISDKYKESNLTVCDPSEVSSHVFSGVYISAVFVLSIMYETKILEHFLYGYGVLVLYHKMLRIRCLPASRGAVQGYWKAVEYILREMARPSFRSSGQNNTL